MSLRRAQKIYTYLSVLTLVLFASGIIADIMILGVLGGVSAVAAIVFHLAYMRCPRCRRHLNAKELTLDNCPYCGDIINEDLLK